MSSRSAAIEVRGLSKSYGATRVLRAIDLDAPAGVVTAILGASGSGKTTLLRLIAGFDTVDAGRIGIGGRSVDDARRAVGPRHRGVGYVPQDGALFPHLTVAGNVGFGVARGQRRARVAELLELVGLPGYQRRYPHQLSGGQQQRVALARALAIRPDVVLLDEPFGSLDAALRESVRSEVIGILARSGTTTVLVTHDQDEALSLAEHVVLLDDGRIAAQGGPRDLYQHPPTPAVATAIGTANVLPGRLAEDGRAATGGVESVCCALGVLGVAARPGGSKGGRPDWRRCQVLLRPEQLRLSSTPEPGSTPVTIASIRYHGHDTLVELTGSSDGRGELGLLARVTGPPGVRPGQPAWVTVVGSAHVWPELPPDAPAHPGPVTQRS